MRTARVLCWAPGYPSFSQAGPTVSGRESRVVRLLCSQRMRVVKHNRGPLPMPDYTLVFNAGSSSLKFCVFARTKEGDWALASRGQVEGIGSSARMSARDKDDRTLLEQDLRADVRDQNGALEAV